MVGGVERFRLDDPDAAEKAARVHEHGVDPDEDVPWNDVRRMEAVLAAMDPSLRRITQADADAAALAAVDDLIDRCQMWRRKRKVEQPRLPTRSEVESWFLSAREWEPKAIAAFMVETGRATEDPEPEVDHDHCPKCGVRPFKGLGGWDSVACQICGGTGRPSSTYGRATEDPEPEVADEYPERGPGFVLGYYEGWADSKAGRQYGEGQHGRRSGLVDADEPIVMVSEDPEPEVDPAHVEADEVTDTLRATAQYLMGRGPAPDIDALAPELRDMVDELLPAIVELVGDRIVPAEPEVDPAQVETLMALEHEAFVAWERVKDENRSVAPANWKAKYLLASGRVQVTPQ